MPESEKKTPPTLAEKLGISQTDSALLPKLALHGLNTPEKMAIAAITRGCDHYSYPGIQIIHAPAISDEELAIGLLSPNHTYEPRWIRVASQLLSSPDCSPALLAKLAIQEQCASVLKYIAECGHKTEPDLPFWKELLEPLENWKSAGQDIKIHISRFRSETGIVNPRTPDFPKITWLRPIR